MLRTFINVKHAELSLPGAAAWINVTFQACFASG